MKSVRLSFRLCLTLSLFLIVVASTVAQNNTPKAPPTEAQMSFEKMKSLAGVWEGKLTTTPPTPEVQDKVARVTLRVTSSGNALMHELQIPGREDDPITMFYLDGDRLTLTHYCDAGNRPRMTGKLGVDGKTLDFKFLDISGEMEYHMHHSRFTLVDATHHEEEWTFMMADKPVLVHFDLHRKN
jgi:hypothetical protein